MYKHPALCYARSMEINEKKPGEKAVVSEGPAKGSELTVVAKGEKTVGVTNGTESWTVRPDLEVE